MDKKVFVIGFHKTGTSSLAEALKVLGYRVCHYRNDLVFDLEKGDLSRAFGIVERYDAFRDDPWPHLYKELDRRYPGSKFILTKRDEEKWIKSVVNHFGKNYLRMREWIYGVGWPKGNEDIYLKKYQEHNREVERYFKDRPDDFLLFDLSGDKWGKLCRFLGKDVPDRDFPHRNKGKKGSFKRVLRVIKKRGLFGALKHKFIEIFR